MNPPSSTHTARANVPAPGTATRGDAAPGPRIGLSDPDLGPLEESFLLRAFRSGWPGPAGPETEALEAEIAARVGVRHAVAVSSGTAALHLALLGLGAGPDRIVVVPTLTFAATANAVVYSGARPVFVDCDPVTGNLDPALLADLLGRLARTGVRPAAVLAVDINGTCADYARLLPVCEAAGVPLIEDAAQALGAGSGDAAAGSFGRCAIFSFSWNKIMTTSAGGMVVSDDAALAARCRHLSTQAREPVVHYEHRDIGYNYRLSNLLAALGRGQLVRLQTMIDRRRALRNRYETLFAGVPGTRILGAGDPGANCWLTSLVVEPDVTGWDAAQLGRHLAGRRIDTRPMWKPMHRQPVFATCEAVVSGAADRLFATSVSLPSGSVLTDSDIDRVAAAIARFLDGR
ncbi:DegT/DnrJ/EryC1/StrS family aminotransferase [Micromonospora sp. RTGN7]|uniref:DegT/DnrJ/EryC1/StrS family aminotransferase n=1 Tax=Micromonospora sp. RTGN7 TaxID=3016526 RepID=UPI0029FED2F2|nr:aminotransferase class I/II-fold pyridoxal phosphate-dependent enzyme [Micromonospora sp. RTGN7]